MKMNEQSSFNGLYSICQPNSRFQSLYSDTNRVVLKTFARTNYVRFTFGVRAFVSLSKKSDCRRMYGFSKVAGV